MNQDSIETNSIVDVTFLGAELNGHGNGNFNKSTNPKKFIFFRLIQIETFHHFVK